MATQLQVRKIHRDNPLLTARQIAIRLDCSPEYVRATARRCGLSLPGTAKRDPKPDSLFALGVAAREAGLTVERIVELHRVGALRP